MDADVDNNLSIITACCMLHNMCEVHGEVFVDSWMDEVHRGNQPHLHCVDVDNCTSRTTSTADSRSI